MGAAEGDLNLVRSLGEQGVHVIVLSEYEDVPAGRSRHCRELVVVPGYTTTPHLLLQALQLLRQRLGEMPVVFPSADPDLKALAQIAGSLHGVAVSTIFDPDMVCVLSDKLKFNDLVLRTGLPVPRTYAPTSHADLEEISEQAQFPLIVKPSNPAAWHRPGIPLSISIAKAILVESPHALSELGLKLLVHTNEFLVQEYIPGGDEEHFDVHAYIDRDGRATASYCGRKWRIYPPHAGSGCFVESTQEPELEALALGILARVGYRGIANINFKRHAVTGDFKLMEINPRVSQWQILTTRSGVNLPWIAYRDVCGLSPAAPPTRRYGLFYVNGIADLRALRIYRREGLWTVLGWLRTLLRPNLIHQLSQWQDPRPAFHVLALGIKRRLGIGRRNAALESSLSPDRSTPA
jgi:predicted ATP-grasp superfamily ATP-dependent carboligase